MRYNQLGACVISLSVMGAFSMPMYATEEPAAAPTVTTPAEPQHEDHHKGKPHKNKKKAHAKQKRHHKKHEKKQAEKAVEPAAS
jgi:hypothetical protein